MRQAEIMLETPRGMRMHIGLFGRRNVGKSSLLNALVGQDVSIVSEIPGTTTDVVAKPMELKPLGPVLFLDTAGVDDTGELGRKRLEKSLAAFQRTDLVFLVSDGEWGDYEEQLAAACAEHHIPVVAVLNKADQWLPDENLRQKIGAQVSEWVLVSALAKTGLEELRQAVVRQAPKDFLDNPALVSDLIGPGDQVVLVVPIDLEAPKGRLILPQVQVIREVLDADACAIVVKERELARALTGLKHPPALVVTDSQVMLKVNADLPTDVKMTSFSVLFARWKGDLETFVQGVQSIDRLPEQANILVLEACSHHPIGDDIGRVKIPRWLRQYTGKTLEFVYAAGHDFPEDLSPYGLILHCGACMTNRREVLGRIMAARKQKVPITNYGLVIAKSQGMLDRILSPFGIVA
jgi:[FeFe] hydrogenase H-cluster maturation GTPase HydF